MTARRPAEIGRDLWRLADTIEADGGLMHPAVRIWADELDALERRWPTADEIADLRQIVEVLEVTNRFALASGLNALVNRLDPPPVPQADDDVDPWALLAEVVAAWADGGASPMAGVVFDIRAALDARGRS